VVKSSSSAWDAIERAAGNVAMTAKIRTKQQAISEILLVRAYDRERQQQLVG
jgi:hypothetical protein